jgi:hypothetical protein
MGKLSPCSGSTQGRIDRMRIGKMSRSTSLSRLFKRSARRMESPPSSGGFQLTHYRRLTPWLSIMATRYVCTSTRAASQA